MEKTSFEGVKEIVASAADTKDWPYRNARHLENSGVSRVEMDSKHERFSLEYGRSYAETRLTDTVLR